MTGRELRLIADEAAYAALTDLGARLPLDEVSLPMVPAAEAARLGREAPSAPGSRVEDVPRIDDLLTRRPAAGDPGAVAAAGRLDQPMGSLDRRLRGTELPAAVPPSSFLAAACALVQRDAVALIGSRRVADAIQEHLGYFPHIAADEARSEIESQGVNQWADGLPQTVIGQLDAHSKRASYARGAALVVSLDDVRDDRRWLDDFQRAVEAGRRLCIGYRGVESLRLGTVQGLTLKPWRRLGQPWSERQRLSDRLFSLGELVRRATTQMGPRVGEIFLYLRPEAHTSIPFGRDFGSVEVNRALAADTPVSGFQAVYEGILRASLALEGELHPKAQRTCASVARVCADMLGKGIGSTLEAPAYENAHTR